MVLKGLQGLVEGLKERNLQKHNVFFRRFFVLGRPVTQETFIISKTCSSLQHSHRGVCGSWERCHLDGTSITLHEGGLMVEYAQQRRPIMVEMLRSLCRACQVILSSYHTEQLSLQHPLHHCLCYFIIACVSDD